MLIGTAKEKSHYWRRVDGKEKHIVQTERTIYHLQCDNCGVEFYRYAKTFNKNSESHVCNNCDQKRFAQKKSATWRQLNKLDASSSKKL